MDMEKLNLNFIWFFSALRYGVGLKRKKFLKGKFKMVQLNFIWFFGFYDFDWVECNKNLFIKQKGFFD